MENEIKKATSKSNNVTILKWILMCKRLLVATNPQRMITSSAVLLSSTERSSVLQLIVLVSQLLF